MVFAWDAAASLYVAKDAAGGIWGLRAENLRAVELMELGDDWAAVPEGAVLPGGAEIRMDLQTGKKLARRIARAAAARPPTKDRIVPAAPAASAPE